VFTEDIIDKKHKQSTITLVTTQHLL